MTSQRDDPVPRIALIIQGEEPPSRSCVCRKCGQGYWGKGALCRECASVFEADRDSVEMVHQALHRKAGASCPAPFPEMVLGPDCHDLTIAGFLVSFRKKQRGYQMTS